MESKQKETKKQYNVKFSQTEKEVPVGEEIETLLKP